MIRRFGQFTLVIFELSRYWHKPVEQGGIVAGQISRRACLAVEMAGRDLPEESREIC